MNITSLSDVIKALRCEEWRPSVCQKCHYGFLDDHGDYPIWSCNEVQLKEDAIFWLELYQYVINEANNNE